MALVLSSVLLGLAGTTAASAYYWLWRHRRPGPALPSPSPTQVSEGIMMLSRGQTGELCHRYEGSHIVVVLARYRGRDVTALVQDYMEGAWAWEFTVSDEVFGNSATLNHTTTSEALSLVDLVIQWEEYI